MAYTLADVTEVLFVMVINEALWSADGLHEVVVDRLEDFHVTEEDIEKWLRYEELPEEAKQLQIMNHLEPDTDYEGFLEEGD